MADYKQYALNLMKFHMRKNPEFTQFRKDELFEIFAKYEKVDKQIKDGEIEQGGGNFYHLVNEYLKANPNVTYKDIRLTQ